MEIRISLLQFEHLIDGKKPEARVGFAMFAPHVFPTLGLASRNATALLVHKHAPTRVCSYDAKLFALCRYDEQFLCVCL